jgi:hypothetical protein
MATLTEIRDKANTRLTSFWQNLVPKQDAYFAKHGKYFQKLVTNQPIDGLEVDWSDNTPIDEKNPADSVITVNDGKLPFAISIDEWVDNDGAGWSATCTIQLKNGTQYQRTRDNQNNDTNWFKVNKLE